MGRFNLIGNPLRLTRLLVLVALAQLSQFSEYRQRKALASHSTLEGQRFEDFAHGRVVRPVCGKFLGLKGLKLIRVAPSCSADGSAPGIQF